MDISFLLLAGGENNRIKPIVKNMPKCLLQFDGIPFLIYLVRKLLSYTERVIISINKFQQHYFLEELAKYNVTKFVTLVIEETPLGTGGSVRLMEKSVSTKQYMLLNADTVLEIDYLKMFEFHCSHNKSVTQALSIHSSQNQGAIGYRVSDQMIISNYENLPKEMWIKKEDVSYFSSTGCYLIDSGTISRIYPFQNFSLEKQVMPTLISINEVKGYVNPPVNFFWDFGVPVCCSPKLGQVVKVELINLSKKSRTWESRAGASSAQTSRQK